MSDPHITFDSQLRAQITSNLKGFMPHNVTTSGLRPAAVAITLVNANENPKMPGIQWSSSQSIEAAIIITRRSAKLKKHAGQWALPGGGIDGGETAEESAIRELCEEVNLDLEPEAIIGRLDDYATRSGFNITPIVIWGGANLCLHPNPDEVASIHHIPLRELLRDDAPLLEDIPESDNPVMRMPIGDSWIAAPTAALIYQFREVALLGKSTRVAHFEQPYFAWK